VQHRVPAGSRVPAAVRALLPVLLPVLLLAALSVSAAAEVSLDPALRILLDAGFGRTAAVLSTLQSPGTASPLPRFTRSAFPEPGTETIEVFLRAPAAPGGDGVSVESVGDDLYAGRVTVSALRRMVDDETITGARLSRPVRPLLDRSGSYLGVARAHRFVHDPDRIEGITGKGVVIGIVDSGIDATHPDFRTADGHTRILRFWDQWWTTGPGPAGYGFGSEYTNTVIDRFPQFVVDKSGHGTHVAGIAAGNGLGSLNAETPYAGVAPEASIVGVSTVFTEVGIVLGARFVFERARDMGMPAVLNLSVGNHFGPHVGTTYFESSLAALVGPGHLIVAAAGNEGDLDIHAETVLHPGETATITVAFPPYDKHGSTFAYLDVEGWFDSANRYRFTVVSPRGNPVGTFTFGARNREYTDEKGLVRGWYTSDLGKGSLVLEFEDNRNSGRVATGEWTLQVEALEVRGNPELDFWIVQWNGLRELPAFTAHVDRGETIISPATADGILAVGALSTRSCWTNASGGQSCYPNPPPFGEMAYFSSRGPTPDGRTKPEVVAPGYGVVSALSSQIAALSDADRAVRSTPDGRYWINQGTSMSAPQAAGTAALLLERYPEMTYLQMRHRLAIRGAPLTDTRSGETVVALRTGEALLPSVDIAKSEIDVVREGVRLQWFTKEEDPVRYRVYKGFDPGGPYFQLASRNITGENPFTLIDRRPDPGRRILYRLVAVDEEGLEDELDTLSVEVTGPPRPVLRAPDPNPGRTRTALRYSLPPSPGGGTFGIVVYDLQGRRVATVDRGAYGPDGVDAVAEWNLAGDAGGRVAAGVYFVSLRYRTAEGSGGDALQRVVVLP
jgi:subtilisin family serine protease